MSLNAAFRAGFADFDPRKIAKFGEADVERLMADPGIIRARASIPASFLGFYPSIMVMRGLTPLSR